MHANCAMRLSDHARCSQHTCSEPIQTGLRSKAPAAAPAACCTTRQAADLQEPGGKAALLCRHCASGPGSASMFQGVQEVIQSLLLLGAGSLAHHGPQLCSSCRCSVGQLLQACRPCMANTPTNWGPRLRAGGLRPLWLCTSQARRLRSMEQRLERALCSRAHEASEQASIVARRMAPSHQTSWTASEQCCEAGKASQEQVYPGLAGNVLIQGTCDPAVVAAV